MREGAIWSRYIYMKCHVKTALYRCESYKHKTHKFFQFSSIKGKDAFIIASIALYNLFLTGEYFHLDPAWMETEHAVYNFVPLTTEIIAGGVASGSFWLCFKPCFSSTTHILPVPSAGRHVPATSSSSSLSHCLRAGTVDDWRIPKVITTCSSDLVPRCTGSSRFLIPAWARPATVCPFHL